MSKECFFNLPQNIQQAILQRAEQQLDIPAAIIEKDYWICWLLNEIFGLPERMTFKGGTSLSKVFQKNPPDFKIIINS